MLHKLWRRQQSLQLCNSYRFLIVGAILSNAACGLQEPGVKLIEVEATQSALTPPAGYSMVVLERGGVKCLKQAATYPDYVCIVDMRRTIVATIHGVHPFKPGTLIEDKDKFYRSTLNDLWATAGWPAIAINASYFGDYMNWSIPTSLSFPYKEGGTLVTAGTDCSTHRGYIKNLYLWWDRQYADVGSMGCSAADFADLTTYGSAPDIISVLDPSYPIDSPAAEVGRTFVGLRDEDGNSTFETLLIYVSKKATRAYARQQLVNFGASKIVMFDGGSSSTLITSDSSTPKVYTSRPLPNALIVWAW